MPNKRKDRNIPYFSKTKSKQFKNIAKYIELYFKGKFTIKLFLCETRQTKVFNRMRYNFMKKYWECFLIRI